VPEKEKCVGVKDTLKKYLGFEGTSKKLKKKLTNMEAKHWKGLPTALMLGEEYIDSEGGETLQLLCEKLDGSRNTLMISAAA